MMKHAQNGTAWALGKPVPGGFAVRVIVWGFAQAHRERQVDEEVRAARIWVETEYNPRRIQVQQARALEPKP